MTEPPRDWLPDCNAPQLLPNWCGAAVRLRDEADEELLQLGHRPCRPGAVASCGDTAAGKRQFSRSGAYRRRTCRGYLSRTHSIAERCYDALRRRRPTKTVAGKRLRTGQSASVKDSARGGLKEISLL